MPAAPSTQPPAVVTGASGFIGKRLVRRLADLGSSIIAVDIAPPQEQVPRVEYVAADLRQTLDPQIGADAEVLYNLAAVHRTPGHLTHEYYETNVFGAGRVTALAEACGLRLPAHRLHEVRIEASQPAPSSDHGRSTPMAEIHQMWRGAGPDLRMITVRPGVVICPGERGTYTHLARALRRGIFVNPSRRDTVKSGEHVDELLRCLDFAAARRAPDVPFNFAFPGESATQDVVNAFGQVKGMPAPSAAVPVAPLLLMAAMFEAANGLGVRAQIHRERVMTLVRSTRIAPACLLASGYKFGLKLQTIWQRGRTGRVDGLTAFRSPRSNEALGLYFHKQNLRDR